jgi:hypothetical protein
MNAQKATHNFVLLFKTLKYNFMKIQLIAKGTLLCLALLGANNPVFGQTAQQDSTYKRHFVGSSLFMLANLLPLSNPPAFYQLNYGYRLTPKDVVSIEAITWTYKAPLGIPYGGVAAKSR